MAAAPGIMGWWGGSAMLRGRRVVPLIHQRIYWINIPKHACYVTQSNLNALTNLNDNNITLEPREMFFFPLRTNSTGR